jgi:hypothetical protein
MSEQAVFEALKYRIEVDVFGTRQYYNKAGQLHRVGGPAIEYNGGHKEWWQNGLRHRENGPAIERTTGAKYWYQNGQYHRTDGPAIILPDVQEWWINGEELSEAEFNQLVNENV